MFYERFSYLCDLHGVKPARVCREIGVNYNSASNWKARGTMPNRATLHKLAEYFNVAESYFYAEVIEPEESRQLKKALDLVSQVPEDKLQRVIDFVSGLLS